MAQVGIDSKTLLQIIRAEDTRRWDGDLEKLLTHADPKVRRRAALAAGRIGNEGAVPPLAEMVLTDRDVDVRQMAAFALGEIESGGGAYALTEVLKVRGDETAPALARARAVEALGKIVAAATSPGAATKPDAEWLDVVQATIVNTLRFEVSRRAQSDRLTVLLALTAVLRAKPDGVGKLVAQCLDYSDPRIVADALNTLARLRLKEGNDKARELLKHNDPIVRANAARVLGATEDKQAFDALLDRALHDADSRVGISAIRSLGNLKDPRAVKPLIKRGRESLRLLDGRRKFPIEPRNELLEIVNALGLINSSDSREDQIQFLQQAREALSHSAEVEIALAKTSPVLYATNLWRQGPFRHRIPESVAVLSWQTVAAHAQGLRQTASATEVRDSNLRTELIGQLKSLVLVTKRSHPKAVSNVLGAYAALKPNDLLEVLRGELRNEDVIVRATAAELLGEQPPSETNTRALLEALPRAMRDADNDAALAILGALAKQKNQTANAAIKTALDSKDHLLRRRAGSLLKANGVGDFSDRIGVVQTRNTEADYRRAMARIGNKPTATVVTNKGSFTIEFLPEDATLNVDNFLQLAKRGYFNGQTVPRVVANFVVQAGDPRGDQNGGPGYTIRCEINEVFFERAAVGMALSGKDTGGSQWFVTHAPQPHLDGGYTVFGRVIRGMEVVDRIARGDRVVRVVVNER
ncbi:MAG TPA: peptidylprolyl isomerase [Pyrinomonadaceae bacterium]|nr:peptidylprolyl isomerase [Pyrinomonadaceae bacterium]